MRPIVAAVALLLAPLVAAGCGDAAVDDAPRTAPESAPTTEAPAGAPDAPPPSPAVAAAPDTDRRPHRAARPSIPGEEDEGIDVPETADGLADVLLTRELTDAERWDAMDLLAKRGIEALPALLRLTRDERYVNWACWRIGELGPAASSAAPTLAACLGSEEGRAGAAWALGELGDAGVAAVRKLLRSGDPAIRRAALEVVAHVGRASREDEAAILAASSEKAADLRRSAARALRAVQEASPAAADALLRLARDDDRAVRAAAFESIVAIGDAMRARAPDLVRLGEADADAAAEVGEALGRLGPDATLLGLASSDPRLRVRTAWYADADDPRVRARLTELLHDTEPDVRDAAVWVFSGHADPPPEVVAAVIEALRSSEDRETRRGAAETLGRLLASGADVSEPLFGALTDASNDVRAAAALALAGNAPPALRERVVAAVRPLWATGQIYGDDAIRVAGAAGALEGRGTDAVAFLAKDASSGSGELRTLALTALGRIGTPEAAEVLLGQLDIVVWDARTAAVQALGACLDADPRVVPALIEQLRTAPRATVRAAAAAALHGKRTAPEVRAALESAVSRERAADVRDAAAAALRD